MADLLAFVAFTLDRARYGLSLDAVDRVVRAVEVTALPGAPDPVLGIINVHGHITPVMNLRRRFGLPDRLVRPADQFILAHTSHRAVALWVDRVVSVVECPPPELVAPDQVLPGLNHLAGVYRSEQGMVLIHDLERFLSLAEEQALAARLKEL